MHDERRGGMRPVVASRQEKEKPGEMRQRTTFSLTVSS